ncbi:MAG: DNA mismatch repair endonuclease MutL [Planctomycetota bacterium]
MTDTHLEPRIAVLPEVVRNQIAAGEVIERPASVVKELVENAIDAGATHIRVDLEEGGVKLVRIVDDGGGMGTADLALAFEAHATSKLRRPEDLEHIASLGFRGEALASMSSIARCRILSRLKGASEAAEVRDEGGRRSQVMPAGAPEGTTIEVRDLFFNVPARRRFLKTTSTEYSRCLDVVQRAALANSTLAGGGVGFVVTHDGKRALDIEPDMPLLARIRRLFGNDIVAELEHVDATDGALRFSGYVAPPRLARRDTSRQMWFLNGRSVRDKVLVRVLKEAYRGVLEDGRQPVAFLQLWMDPALVDVNVHPAKSEVRFRDERRIFGFLVGALREAVRRTDMATPGESMLQSLWRREGRAPEPQRGPYLPDPGPLRTPGSSLFAPRRDAGAGASSSPYSSPSGSPSSGPYSGPYSGAPAGSTGAERDLLAPYPPARRAEGDAGDPHEAPVGAASERVSEAWAPVDDLRGPYLQVAKTYIIRALPDGFEIIDQHALHERLTYEGLLADVRANHVEIQRWLTPELVELGRADVELLSGHFDALRRVGIDLAVFGEDTVAVHGLPARMKHPDPEGLVRDLVELIGRTGRAPAAEDVIEEVLHRAACRSSIMAGDVLDQTQMEALLRRARGTGEDQTCPHARPTRVRFSLAELEKAFHRR